MKKTLALCVLFVATILVGCEKQPDSEISTTEIPMVTTVAPETTAVLETTVAPQTTAVPQTTVFSETTSVPETTEISTVAAPVTTAPVTTFADTTSVATTLSAVTESPATTDPVENGPIELAPAKQDPSGYFSNPQRSITHIGDPFILFDDASQKYYMYCTGGYFKCWSSDTMKNWKAEGDTYAVTDNTFGTKNFWAPEVYQYNGAYYMVYSAANDSGRHSIGLAKATGPTGPFTDVYAEPLFAPDYSVIDANLLFDDDGRVYLFYSKDCSENTVDGVRTSQIWGVELAADLSAVMGEPVLLATPADPWELLSGNTLWNEGPFVFKDNGTYYLLYSANYYASANYAVGYATASSPLGIYTKAADNPLVVGDKKNTSGTGHCSVTRSPDGTELYIAYHSHLDVNITNVVNRTPNFDKLVIRSDGRLAVTAPSITMQPLPSGANGTYKKYTGVTISSAYEQIIGDTKNLLDEVVPMKTPKTNDMYRFTCTEDGYIELQYDTAVTLDSLWIYGIHQVALSPRSVYAVINDAYKTAAVAFSDITPLNPAVISLNTLPAGVAVQNVKLYFDGGEIMAISEIITVAKR